MDRYMADRARTWLYQSASRFRVQACQTVAEETLATFGAELALLLWLETRLRAGQDEPPTLRQWRRLLKQFHTREIVRRVATSGVPAASSGWLLHELILARRHAERMAAASTVQNSNPLGRHLPPLRRLELLYFLSQTGAAIPAEELRTAVLEASPCDTRHFPLTTQNLYYLTHFLFYATDFGLGTPSVLTPTETKWLIRHVGAGMQWALKEPHADLLIELAINAKCLHDRGLVEQGEAFIDDLLAQPHSRLLHEPEDVHQFMGSYHPVLVYCILDLLRSAG